jgi:dipeptide/tripeptide permease
MSTRTLYYLGAGVGGTIASSIPALWGGSLLSGWSILLSGVGGLAGIFVMYKITH